MLGGHWVIVIEGGSDCGSYVSVQTMFKLNKVKKLKVKVKNIKMFDFK